MRRPIRMLFLGVVVPGALTPALWAAVSSGEGEEAAGTERTEIEVREVAVDIRVEEEPRVEVDVAAAPRVRLIQARSAPDCRYAAETSHELAATASDRLELLAGSGGLRVEGTAGLDEVRVEAHYCASDEAYLDEMSVELGRSGDEVRLETRYPDFHGSWGERRYARIDLVVRVPEGMAADVEDSSGSAWLSGLGALYVEDGSGELVITGGLGPVVVDDGSGDVRIDGVRGDVRVEDGSGGVDIRNVTGSVELDDGSGSVDVSDVTGDVVIDDGSGSIDVRTVGGDFVVTDDGSGGIRYSDVQGRVDVPRKERRRGR